MPSGPLAGFGIGPFGSMPFGTSMPPETPIELLGLLAIRENVIRLEFNVPPRFTRLLDPTDASDPRRFTVVEVDGTVGRNGLAVRAVRVIQVERVNPAGTLLDIILDRPMSPEPALYDVTLTGIVSDFSGDPLPSTTARVVALFKTVPPLVASFAFNGRDIANPQSRVGIYDPLPVAEGQDLDSLLGTFPLDSQFDLAFDEGEAGYRKRVYRRLTTRKNGFKHLPGYGVSMLESLKQLQRVGIREFVAEEAESQIRLEPETVSVSVEIFVPPDALSVARYRIRARCSFGDVPNFEVPLAFSPTGI